MATNPLPLPVLPPALEQVFADHAVDPEALLRAYMPVFCDAIHADRIFCQPRNPLTRVCKILKWRRRDSVPWTNIPGDTQKEGEWFKEPQWEITDPLWAAAMQGNRSIYVSDLQTAADQGLLNLQFETEFMFHTAFIHGHAIIPHYPLDGTDGDMPKAFYGSMQPAVFNPEGKNWDSDKDLVERCLIRIAPVFQTIGMSAPVIN